MHFNGKIIGTLISNLIFSLNENKMVELDFAWKQMVESEFLELRKSFTKQLRGELNNIENLFPIDEYSFLQKFMKIRSFLIKLKDNEICIRNIDKFNSIYNEFNQFLDEQ